MKHTLTWLLFLSVCLGACTQQTDPAPEPEAADLNPGMAAIDFETSCSPEVKSAFDEAVALLHNMTYHVAEARFQGILEQDPGCGMAYWGMAMSYIHPLWFEEVSDSLMAHGADLLVRARETDLTDREAAYIDALDGFYRLADQPLFDQLDAYAAGFARVYEAYPDDPEAQAFFALAHLVNQRPGTVDREVVDASVAASYAVLEEKPGHPGAHHYIIHAFDTPDDAHRAEDVARSYAKIVPDNPHALHMPTHIFTRLGLWHDSIELNIRSADVAKTMPFGDAVSVHYPHALDYLLFGYLQTGQEGLARQAVEALQAIQMPVEVSPASAYHLAAADARWTLERHQWAEAAKIQPRRPADFPWDDMPQFEALAQFAVALGGARAGDLEAATRGIDRLMALEEKTEHPYWKQQTKVMRLAAEGWLAEHHGDPDKAEALLQEANTLEAGMIKHAMTPGEILPANELLGELLLAHGKPQEALAAYELSLTRTPNRFNSLYGAGQAAEALGDTDRARAFYQQLVDVCELADTGREELAYAKAYVSEA